MKSKGQFFFFFITQIFSNENIETKSPSVYNTISDLVLNNYRKYSTYSISRCPYKESCSYYFQRNINERGVVLGLLHFIDRYYYREHNHIINKYPLYIDKDNKIKSNDKINYNYWNYLGY